MLQAQRNLADASRAFRRSLEIRERLAKIDPSNTNWQNDLAFSYARIGDILSEQSDLPGALQAHRNGLAIRERLAKIDPGNKDWQRALSFSYERVADVHEDQGNLLVSQGNLSGALKAFREGLASIAKAASADSDRQRDLLAAYRRVGDVLFLQNDLSEALTAYRNGLAVAERLVKSEPDKAEWQRDLEEIADNLDRLAYQFLLVRDFGNALASADQAIASAPDRVSSYLNRAHALMFLGRPDEARAVYLIL
jgi:tetratricopeptide (TPR) repeat protein